MDTTVTSWDIEIVRDACLRRGMSLEEAFEVVETCAVECSNGDPGLLEILRQGALN